MGQSRVDPREKLLIVALVVLNCLQPLPKLAEIYIESSFELNLGHITDDTTLQCLKDAIAGLPNFDSKLKGYVFWYLILSKTSMCVNV